MSRTKIAIALIAGSLALAGAASASEQRGPTGPHHEQHGREHAPGRAGPQTAGDTQSAAGFLSAAAVLDQLTKQGYSAFTDVKLDDGKYELEGRDADGRKVEIDVDARTGAILKVEQD